MKSLRSTTLGLLSAFNLHPKKRLGQNFLIDQMALDRIINAAELNGNDEVLEIGTGLGVLTEALAGKVKKVVSLDPDKDMIQISKQVLSGCSNVELIAADFLKWKPHPLSLPAGRQAPLHIARLWRGFVERGDSEGNLNSSPSPSMMEKGSGDEEEGHFTKVVANVPYYITSPIIEKLLAEPRSLFAGSAQSLIVLTVQKEVAERITARPGSRTFGSFTVFVQNRAEAAIDSIVSKRSFYPSPDVDSAILVLRPYGAPKYKIDEKLVRAAFSQRRKMIRSSLSKFNLDFEKIGIDPRRRPETLGLEEFERLSRNG